MSSDPSLGVYKSGQRVGTLSREETGGLCFSYTQQWLDAGGRALSLSLPLSDEPYRGEATWSYFDGLLPEREVRAAVCRKLGVEDDDLLALLGALAGDCPGAVSLCRGETPDRQRGYLELSRAQLSDMVASPPVLPQLSGAGGIRLTLAGPRDKLPVYLDGSRIYLPVGGSPSSHLLKFGSEEELAEELFANLVARGLGLSVPDMVMVPVGSFRVLVIKRFDRILDDSDKLQRLHQENLVRAAGGAVTSLARCFELVAAHSLEPALDLEALLRWQVFNVLLKNPAGHARHLAFVESGTGLRLAPFYGLHASSDPDTSLALAVGLQSHAASVDAVDFKAVAPLLGVKPRYLINILSEMTDRLEPARQEATAQLEQRYGVVGQSL